MVPNPLAYYKEKDATKLWQGTHSKHTVLTRLFCYGIPQVKNIKQILKYCMKMQYEKNALSRNMSPKLQPLM